MLKPKALLLKISSLKLTEVFAVSFTCQKALNVSHVLPSRKQVPFAQRAVYRINCLVEPLSIRVLRGGVYVNNGPTVISARSLSLRQSRWFVNVDLSCLAHILFQNRANPPLSSLELSSTPAIIFSVWSNVSVCFCNAVFTVSNCENTGASSFSVKHVLNLDNTVKNPFAFAPASFHSLYARSLKNTVSSF